MMELFFILHILMMRIPILGRSEKTDDHIQKDFREMTTHGYVPVQYMQSILPMTIPYFTALQDWLTKQCFLQGLTEYSIYNVMFIYTTHV